MNRVGRSRWALLGRIVLVVAFGANSVSIGASGNGGRYLTVLSAVIVLCTGLLLLRRLPWPAAPFLTTAAAAWSDLPMLGLLSIALFDLAVRRRVRPALGCLVVVFAANVVAAPANSLWHLDRYAGVLSVPLLAVVSGSWIGNRRRLVDALAADVEHLRVEAQLREQAARTAERSRIAMEMHDVLAHRLSLIALHAGVLTTRKDMLPAPVVERLGLLRGASTEALADLRDVLGALRDPEASGSDASLTPIMVEVRDLVEQARAAGQQVELTAEGHPEKAPTTHRLAVYRIVQEALTNARKHAAAGDVDVRVEYRPYVTLVEVTNTAGVAASGTVDSGYGLVGLRERVTALRGHLRAGPNGAGGWRVSGYLPHPTYTDQQEVSA